MKPRQNNAALILFLFLSVSLTHVDSVEQRNDDTEERSEAIVSIPKKKFDYAIGCSPKKRTQFVSLYDKALQVTGDSTFSRMLEHEQVLQEEQSQKLALQQQGNGEMSSFAFPYSSLFVPVLLAFATHNGFSISFEDTFKKLRNLILVAWLPVLLFNASWIEISSFALLLFRPTVWSFLVDEFFTDTWTISKKLLLSELWRHFWKHTTHIFPIPNLSPSDEYLELTPDWFQMGFARVTKLVDKFAQGLVRKSIERCFQESLGITVGALSEYFLKNGHDDSLGRLNKLDAASAACEQSPGESEVEAMVVERAIERAVESDAP
ncbi:unnamed protein product [Cylindrotheca closterium]|uniref:Uncharacterized protein n=1 Tax=Cylindrotheca closterium TaxID=2856 RepID=A0AAD2CTQ4_9STRA|nr:unnamed protein product [Cylindrotheca closterium]